MLSTWRGRHFHHGPQNQANKDNSESLGNPLLSTSLLWANNSIYSIVLIGIHCWSRFGHRFDDVKSFLSQPSHLSSKYDVLIILEISRSFLLIRQVGLENFGMIFLFWGLKYNLYHLHIFNGSRPPSIQTNYIPILIIKRGHHTYDLL